MRYGGGGGGGEEGGKGGRGGREKINSSTQLAATQRSCSTFSLLSVHDFNFPLSSLEDAYRSSASYF